MTETISESPSLAAEIIPAAPLSIAADPLRRLDSLDLLRGVAILGILLMNTQSMSMPSSAYYNPTDYGDFTGLNRIAWTVVHIVADVKFITTFSILFGAGILLQGERLAAKGVKNLSAAGVHYRRMLILLLFGLIHAYCLWYGDILVPYALLGMLLFPIRRLPPSLLIFVGVLSISMATFMAFSENQQLFAPVQKLREWSTQMTEGVASSDFEIEAYRGGWRKQMDDRVWLSLENETTAMLTWTGWRCAGAMLIGMGLQRFRFFHGAWPRPAYAALAAFAIPVGWAITGVGVLYNTINDWNWTTLYFPGEQFNYWGSLIAALGYISLGTLIAIRAADSRWLRILLTPIRSVGKMALSNYILQTLIGTTIFYGHGYGKFGYVSRVGLIQITVTIWAAQLIISTLWLALFRQGPLEWLWHKLVYFGRPAN